jgi:NAD(P)-dependent dehydrogenase (short-subunit alcohol dehydrogenase family)
VCIVTGASRGIGAAIALALGSQGGASWAVFSLGSLST